MAELKKGAYKVVAGATYGTPKEVWGFRQRGRGDAKTIARRFLTANAELFGLHARLHGLRHRATIRSLGADHVLFQQTHRGVRINRAYVTVHVAKGTVHRPDGKRRIAKGRHVFLVKNRATPAAWLPETADFRVTEKQAQARARKAAHVVGKRAKVWRAQKRWFFKDEKLHPSYRVRIHRDKPRREWIIYVNAKTGGVLSKYDNLAAATGRGHVFDPNPVIALGDHRPLVTKKKRLRRPPEDAYAQVRLRGLKGNGRLEGKRVTTKPTSDRVRSSDHDFRFLAHEEGFEEVMSYYHLDEAIRYLESLGYRGPRAIFKKPLAVDVNGTRKDNSWYSPGMRQLTFGTGGVDDAEDADIILHEFGHALQDAICPDFGQSVQAAAMGEGFGDYLAVSFFAEKKKRHYRTSVMTWDGILWGDDNDPPSVRRVDEDLTFESFDHGDDAEEHDNGRIWSATLWDIRRALGRTIADTLIIESHFQLDGYTKFARGARAILDADDNLYAGAHRRRLRSIFHARGIAPVT